MKQYQNTPQPVETRFRHDGQVTASLPPAAEPYTAPDIEVTDIELQNVFAASPTGGQPNGFPGYEP